jgi:hypothetical protein
MTESFISNILYSENQVVSKEKENEIFEGLVKVLFTFYNTAHAPPLVNNMIFALLTRLIQHRKRFRERDIVLREEDSKQSLFTPEEHFNKIGISDKKQLEELVKEMDDLRNDEFAGTEVISLYSSFIQNAAELIISTLMPTDMNEKIKSISKIIDLPSWLDSLAQVALLLSYFDSSESKLSDEMEDLCFSGTDISDQWDKVLVIKNLPRKYTREEITNSLKDIISSNKGTILDINLPKDDDFKITKEIFIKENKKKEKIKGKFTF